MKFIFEGRKIGHEGQKVIRLVEGYNKEDAFAKIQGTMYVTNSYRYDNDNDDDE